MLRRPRPDVFPVSCPPWFDTTASAAFDVKKQNPFHRIMKRTCSRLASQAAVAAPLCRKHMTTEEGALRRCSACVYLQLCPSTASEGSNKPTTFTTFPGRIVAGNAWRLVGISALDIIPLLCPYTHLRYCIGGICVPCRYLGAGHRVNDVAGSTLWRRSTRCSLRAFVPPSWLANVHRWWKRAKRAAVQGCAFLGPC